LSFQASNSSWSAAARKDNSRSSSNSGGNSISGSGSGIRVEGAAGAIRGY
jgi:hypothetical protein